MDENAELFATVDSWVAMVTDIGDGMANIVEATKTQLYETESAATFQQRLAAAVLLNPMLTSAEDVALCCSNLVDALVKHKRALGPFLRCTEDLTS